MFDWKLEHPLDPPLFRIHSSSDLDGIQRIRRINVNYEWYETTYNHDIYSQNLVGNIRRSRFDFTCPSISLWRGGGALNFFPEKWKAKTTTTTTTTTTKQNKKINKKKKKLFLICFFIVSLWCSSLLHLFCQTVCYPISLNYLKRECILA